MRPETRQTLCAIDRRFYLRHAAGFAGSRRLAWPGWGRALGGLRAVRGRLCVLDAGCAHGRLAGILADRYAGTKIDYLGLDSCAPLLARGGRDQRARSLLSTCFVQADLLAQLPLLPAAPIKGNASTHDDDSWRGFDLITLFGVLHHVPGHAARRDLLIRLGRLLAPGGRFVVTAWRVEKQPGFATKRVPWSAGDVDRGDLEAGDHLLGWGDDRETPRYCHATSDPEADALAAASGLKVEDRFEADGPQDDSNLYLVLTTKP